MVTIGGSGKFNSHPLSVDYPDTKEETIFLMVVLIQHSIHNAIMKIYDSTLGNVLDRSKQHLT